MNKKKRRRLVEVIGRIGAATNLRPAGAHKSKRHPNRSIARIALKKELDA